MSSLDALGETRVLLCDDDPILREFAISHLSLAKREVMVAPDGRAGLEALRAGAFDLALVDLDMPVMDGFALIAEIRNDPNLKHLPVIVVTGREDMVAIDQAFETGANSFVVKPLNWRLLSHQINYVLRNARMEQRLRDADSQKTNMLRLMRHEFNTPLNAITGFSRHIAQATQDPSTQTHITYVINAARDLQRVTDDLFEASVAITSDAPINPAAFTVSEVMRAAARAALHDTGASAQTLKMVNAAGECEITTDFKALQGILRHLVRNALTHGSPGPAAAPAVFRAAVTADGTGLSFSIRDFGPGMSAEALVQASMVFQQGDNALTRGSTGLGLGLAVVIARAKAIGAQVELLRHPDGLEMQVFLQASINACAPSDTQAAGPTTLASAA
jgi:two-component system, sensor histidine kinase and response regulator